jgi:RNA-directed DNA polymerase
MPKEEPHIRYIRKLFAAMQTKEDLLDLLNYAKGKAYKGKSFPFALNQLTWFSNPGINKERYFQFEVPKKRTGEIRTIHAPVPGLKSLQKTLAYILECVFDPHKAATGFVAGRSVVDNARIHAGNWYVYNIDLKDFFSSVDQARVWKCLQLPPFNLQSKTVANILAAICCTEMDVERINSEGKWVQQARNVLPQGAPTSPILSNVVCQRLDYLLSAVAKRFGAKYSRYADDITFSSLHNIYQADGEFFKELERIITEQRFHIKPSKTRLQKQGYRQEVTGLTVNEKPNVSKRYIKQLRKWLYYWERYGYTRATHFFSDEYSAVKPGFPIPNMTDVLRGKLNFLSMVRGEKDPLFKRLWDRYLALLPDRVKIPLALSSSGVTAVANVRPKETVKFLKYFKYDNEYSFKHLVHPPIDDAKFDFFDLLKKVQTEFNYLARTYDNKLDLPKDVYNEVVSLFNLLGTEGLKYFEKNRQHPIDEPEIGKKIQEFKKAYRFGNEKTESTILVDALKTSALKSKFNHHDVGIVYSFGEEDTSGMFNIDQLHFVQGEQVFQGKANFFTWVPSVRSAFGVMFENILKHSKLNGKRPFRSEDKKIAVTINRSVEGDAIKVELSVLDKGSVFMGNMESLLKDFRREYLWRLKGVCDFKVQFLDISGQAYECQILPYAESVEKIATAPGGFKYIFTFYD